MNLLTALLFMDSLPIQNLKGENVEVPYVPHASLPLSVMLVVGAVYVEESRFFPPPQEF